MYVNEVIVWLLLEIEVEYTLFVMGNCKAKFLFCVGAGGCCCVRAYLSSVH